MLKHSAADWCFYREDDDPFEYYRKIKELGYEGVEMAPEQRWQAARAAGLKLVNLSAPGMQQGFNRLENHARLLDEARQLIQVAKLNQVDHIIIFSGNREGQGDEDGLRNVILAGKMLARDAEEAGVLLALEVLNSFDHADYQADHLEYLFEFAQAVNSPAVKVLVDLYHLQRMGGIDLQQILTNLEYVAHIHLAGSPKRDFPGEHQEIDYAPLVRAIHAAGYRGFWGKEFIPGVDRFAELEQARQLIDLYV